MAFPIQLDTFSAERNPQAAGQIFIKNTATGAPLATLDTAKCRAKLFGFGTATMNLSAAVKILRFAAAQVPAAAWQMPHDLNGSPADFPKIATDEIIAAFALLQARAGLGVDGQPGGQFVAKVMGWPKTFLEFMNETGNANRSLAGDAPLPVPDRDNPDDAANYDFCRQMVLARNGLWSDAPGVTNLCGLRYRKAGTRNSWNDVLAICWLDPATGAKCFADFLGTTEPGNPLSKPTVPPQTYLVRAGFHHAKMPGGRGSCLMAKDAANRNLVFDNTDGRGINFHPGGSTIQQHSFTASLPGGGVTDEAQFARQLALAEAFSTLSRWGLDKNTAARSILQKWTALKPIQVVSANENTMELAQGTQHKSLKVNDIRQWLAQFWVTKKQSPQALFDILKYEDAGYQQPGSPANVAAVAASITAAHVAAIVRRQANYFEKLDDVDGKAGPIYQSILAGTRTSVADLIASAGPDSARADALGQTPGILPAHRAYLQTLRFDTLGERSALAALKLPRLKIGELAENVGDWSTACQVIFGMEQFYKFWFLLTCHAAATGQRHWYYTLVERNSF